MPGLNVPSETREYVRAPEQARLTEVTPSPMCTSADLGRWNQGIASPVPFALLKYAVGPSASVREGEPFVLPAQRPASPDIAESPSATTVSARAAAGSAARTINPNSSARIRSLLRFDGRANLVTSAKMPW